MTVPQDEQFVELPEPAVGQPKQDKKHLVYGGAGLAIGLLAGLLFGQIDLPQTSDAITQAVAECGVEATSDISVGDDGQSLSMHTEGAESAGAAYSDVACVLVELETTDSVMSRIETTRALDGRQSGKWGELSASWGYHPDNGLDIVITVVQE